MNKIVEAIYEAGVLKLLEDPGLQEHERVRISIDAKSYGNANWYEPYISQDPNVRQGRPCIVGTGIEVSLLVAVAQTHQQTLEEIAREHGISQMFAQAAMDYYQDHTDDVDFLISQHLHETGSAPIQEPREPLVAALKNLSLTHRETARALMRLLQAGQRQDVETLLKAIQNAEAA